MALAKVSGTRIRGGRYFLNIAVPHALRASYDGKATLNTAIGTADPRVAMQAVTIAQADMIARQREMAKVQDQAALIAALPQDQRALFDSAGGLEGLLQAYEASRVSLAFMEGHTPPDEATTPLEADLRDAEDDAARQVLTQTARQEAKTLNALGKNVAVPGGTFETLADVAKAFVTAKSFTVQHRESIAYTMRRWTEFHGDVALADLTREMLWTFDDAVKGLPKTNALGSRLIDLEPEQDGCCEGDR